MGAPALAARTRQATTLLRQRAVVARLRTSTHPSVQCAGRGAVSELQVFDDAAHRIGVQV